MIHSKKAPIIAGSVLILGVAAYMTFTRSSPGELSKQHAKVAGSSLITDCNKCHKGKDVSTGCLACHAEIKAQLDDNKGYHGYLKKEGKAICASCHGEHNGAQFELINSISWEKKDPKTFDHSYTHFSLSGKHQKIECADCHHKKLKTPFSLPQFHDQQRPSTYLGLSQTCINCHNDVHAGGLANNCLQCHGQESFVPTTPFNHDKYFPLKGGHVKLTCVKCHPLPPTDSSGNRSNFFPFDNVKGKTCADCHTNPHAVDWKRSCEDCHQASDLFWKQAAPRMSRQWHVATGFSLSVPHQKPSCEKCHPESLPFSKKYPNPRQAGYSRGEKQCEGCHQDPHGGQFAVRFQHCISCHQVKSFSPPKFGKNDHKIYPLTGGHLKTECNTCHVIPANSHIRQFSGTSKNCADCHKDSHFGQFRTGNSVTCEKCHDSFESWKKTSFDHNKQSDFILDKAHIHVACGECHPKVTLKNGQKTIQYKNIGKRCQDCHEFK